jgi:hypothetical protein
LRLEVTFVIEKMAACGVMHFFLQLREMSSSNTFLWRHSVAAKRDLAPAASHVSRIRRASSFVSSLAADRQPWRAVPPTRPANSILSLFLRANYALRWVNITQAEKMCDGTRNPFGIFDQKQSNNHSQSEKQCQSDQGHDGLPQIVVGRFCVGH